MNVFFTQASDEFAEWIFTEDAPAEDAGVMKYASAEEELLLQSSPKRELEMA